MNNSWFTTYSYFDAPTSAQPGVEWWVYDITTGESSTPNQTGLSAWLGPNTDSDGDGLPDWYEFVLGTNPFAWSTVYDGISDGWKVRYGLNPLDPNLAGQIASGGGGTILQDYQAGRRLAGESRFAFRFGAHRASLYARIARGSRSESFAVLKEAMQRLLRIVVLVQASSTF